MGYLFKTIRSGVMKPAGVIDIPFLGAKVAEMNEWTLQRRGDTGPDAGLYDLRASFSFVSKALWEDEAYDKRVVVSLSPKRQFRLEQAPEMRTVLQDKSLLMEGVRLVSVQR